MYPAPPGAVARLVEHHRVESYVSLENTALPVSDGSVVVDARRAVRRTCSLRLLDVDGTLANSVTPYGAEVSIFQRLTWDDGLTWTVPLGVFILSDPVFDQSPTGVTVSVEGEDRSRRVARAGRTYPVGLAKTDTLTFAVSSLIAQVYPNLDVTTTDGVDPVVGSTLNYLEGPDSNSWADAVLLAASLGYDLYFDVYGNPILTPFPGAVRVQQPDAFYSPGPITEARRAGGDESTFSGVIVVALSSTGAPLRAEVWDTDPDSPTYVYGEFGFVPYWIEIQTPSSQEQVNEAARSALSQVTGASQALEWQQIPNPGADAWDVISVDLPQLSQRRASVIVDSVTIPLGLSTSTVRARDGRWVL
jgi:hypothetical protein